MQKKKKILYGGTDSEAIIIFIQNLQFSPDSISNKANTNFQ